MCMHALQLIPISNVLTFQNGQTALHIAAHGCKAEAVTLLLAAGADVATVDNNGLTPMHLLLITHGENVCCFICSIYDSLILRFIRYNLKVRA